MLHNAWSFAKDYGRFGDPLTMLHQADWQKKIVIDHHLEPYHNMFYGSESKKGYDGLAVLKDSIERILAAPTPAK